MRGPGGEGFRVQVSEGLRRFQRYNVPCRGTVNCKI